MVICLGKHYKNKILINIKWWYDHVNIFRHVNEAMLMALVVVKINIIGRICLKLCQMLKCDMIKINYKLYLSVMKL